MQAPEKPKRKRTLKDGPESKTKPKGTPVSGKQSSTLFGAPNGNKPGQTSEQRKAAIKAAELATIAMAAWLEDLVDKVTKDPERALEHLDNTRLSLVNSAQDRAYGKASSSLDVTSSDGSAQLPSVIRLVGPDTPSDG